MPPSAQPRSRLRCCKGLSLLELIVVLAILVALAGIVLVRVGPDLRFNVGGEALSAEEIATRQTFAVVRSAILGSDVGTPGFRQDTGRYPETMAELFERPTDVPPFAPAYGIGWRGPYILPTGARYTVDPAIGFTDDYGDDGDPAVLDAWGRPIVLQQAGTENLRLVSAGPNRVLDTLEDADGTDREDDLVLFLRIPDPLP